MEAKKESSPRIENETRYTRRYSKRYHEPSRRMEREERRNEDFEERRPRNYQSTNKEWKSRPSIPLGWKTKPNETVVNEFTYFATDLVLEDEHNNCNITSEENILECFTKMVY